MNPGSQEQLKFPAGRLMQRPWGPHTLDEMCHTRLWVSLVATATVQLSITEGKNQRRRSAERRLGSGPHRPRQQNRCATLAVVGLAVVLELRAGPAFVVVRAAAVEISLPVVALGLVVARVGAAGVTLDLE